MKPSLYLAGPIFGCSEGEAKNWRQWVAAQLPFMRCISPLRCEPAVDGRYDVAYNDPCFGQPKSILAKNFLDLRACDMTLAYFPKPESVDHVALAVEVLRKEGYGAIADSLGRVNVLRSIGSIGEISWAYALRKPCVIVSNDQLVQHHPFTSVQPDWPVLPDLDQAVRLIKGLWTDYAS